MPNVAVMGVYCSDLPSREMHWEQCIGLQTPDAKILNPSQHSHTGYISPWAAPRQWFCMAEKREHCFCLTKEFSNMHSLLWDLPSRLRISQNCAAVCNSSYSIILLSCLLQYLVVRPAFGLKTLLAYRYYFCPFPPSLVFPRINLLHIHVHLGVYKRTWTSMCNPCLPPKFWKIVSHSLTLQNQQKLILSPQRFKKQTHFYQLVPSRLF